MIRLLALIVLVAMAATVLAADLPLGRQAPPKPVGNAAPPAPRADVTRQGGDTIADAVTVVLPVVDLAGTTAGYTDDYDEVCPYTNSTSPDVVYTFSPDMAAVLDVDLCGSSYDTKVYVYDEGLNLVACNDDFYFDDDCGVYVSKIEAMPVAAGTVYYVVIDGYGGDAGEYLLTIVGYDPCELDIPVEAMSEGEPPLEDGSGILDCHNGGCQFVGACDTRLWQFLEGDGSYELVFHGVSGFYLDAGSNFRDTDWFDAVIGPNGTIEIVADAEQGTYLFQLAPLDCGTVEVAQVVEIGPCSEGSMTITGAPGETVWIWVGPQAFSSPSGDSPFEYDYLLWLSGLESGPVAVEPTSWSAVRSLYR